MCVCVYKYDDVVIKDVAFDLQSQRPALEYPQVRRRPVKHPAAGGRSAEGRAVVALRLVPHRHAAPPRRASRGTGRPTLVNAIPVNAIATAGIVAVNDASTDHPMIDASRSRYFIFFSSRILIFLF